MTTAKVIERPAQGYVAIRAEVAPAELAKQIDRNFGAVFAFLGQTQIEPAGPPFVKYNRIDMAASLELEFGVPIRTNVAASGAVFAGTLPAGRYGVLIHQGHYDGLRAANAALLDWGKQRGIDWDSEQTPAGERFACRLETYLNDPRKEPDPTKLQTEIAIKLR